MIFSVRRATISDAQTATVLVRRSIGELCFEDHHGDEATIAAWLANKTEANFRRWIESERHIALVAAHESDLLGFGLLNLGGKLALLYVSPEARFAGISSAILHQLEREALDAGLREITLDSSATALTFYQRRGYSPNGEISKGFVTWRHPLSKRLTEPSCRLPLA